MSEPEINDENGSNIAVDGEGAIFSKGGKVGAVEGKGAMEMAEATDEDVKAMFLTVGDKRLDEGSGSLDSDPFLRSFGF